MQAALTIKGFRGAAQYIKAMTRVAKYFPKQYDDISAAAHRMVMGDLRETFRTEGGNIGQPWPDLAIKTMAERMKAMFSPAHPIHERTGSLKKTLTMPSGVGPGMHNWSTVKFSTGGMLCRLEVNHPAKFSHPHHNYSGNLVDMLQKGSGRRPKRPMYDENGYGVSSKCADGIYRLVEKTTFAVLDNLVGKNILMSDEMDDRFDMEFTNIFGEKYTVPGSSPGYYY